MADPRIVRGAVAPLFERLVDLSPADTAEADVYRLVSADMLQASVRRQIEWILSTRRSVTINEALREDALTVLEYGIPDWSSLSAHDDGACGQFALAVEMAVRAFEPRLARASVSVVPGRDRKDALNVQISGMLSLSTATEDVSFPFEFTTAPSRDPA